MKEKSNATLRRAASLRCRTDAAIERLGRNISCYERGYITPESSCGRRPTPRAGQGIWSSTRLNSPPPAASASR